MEKALKSQILHAIPTISIVVIASVINDELFYVPYVFLTNSSILHITKQSVCTTCVSIKNYLVSVAKGIFSRRDHQVLVFEEAFRYVLCTSNLLTVSSGRCTGPPKLVLHQRHAGDAFIILGTAAGVATLGRRPLGRMLFPGVLYCAYWYIRRKRKQNLRKMALGKAQQVVEQCQQLEVVVDKSLGIVRKLESAAKHQNFSLSPGSSLSYYFLFPLQRQVFLRMTIFLTLQRWYADFNAALRVLAPFTDKNYLRRLHKIYSLPSIDPTLISFLLERGMEPGNFSHLFWVVKVKRCECLCSFLATKTATTKEQEDEAWVVLVERMNILINSMREMHGALQEANGEWEERLGELEEEEKQYGRVYGQSAISLDQFMRDVEMKLKKYEEGEEWISAGSRDFVDSWPAHLDSTQKRDSLGVSSCHQDVFLRKTTNASTLEEDIDVDGNEIPLLSCGASESDPDSCRTTMYISDGTIPLMKEFAYEKNRRESLTLLH
ncbi:uncharacterized protein VTP21DRAFT_10292 [Calcarisporiella thermophila]|uniref:uncharacterized protein n=1 Tax=Calcarisporiella thermophila TaxID=911321 RepID=UPI0037423A03